MLPTQASQCDPGRSCGGVSLEPAAAAAAKRRPLWFPRVATSPGLDAAARQQRKVSAGAGVGGAAPAEAANPDRRLWPVAPHQSRSRSRLRGRPRHQARWRPKTRPPGYLQPNQQVQRIRARISLFCRAAPLQARSTKQHRMRNGGCPGDHHRRRAEQAATNAVFSNGSGPPIQDFQPLEFSNGRKGRERGSGIAEVGPKGDGPFGQGGLRFRDGRFALDKQRFFALKAASGSARREPSLPMSGMAGNGQGRIPLAAARPGPRPAPERGSPRRRELGILTGAAGGKSGSAPARTRRRKAVPPRSSGGGGPAASMAASTLGQPALQLGIARRPSVARWRWQQLFATVGLACIAQGDRQNGRAAWAGEQDPARQQGREARKSTGKAASPAGRITTTILSDKGADENQRPRCPVGNNDFNACGRRKSRTKLLDRSRSTLACQHSGIDPRRSSPPS